MKSIVPDTLDEAGCGNASTLAWQQSNSETAIDAHFDAAARKKQFASSNSFGALIAHAEVGGHLIELKKLLCHGYFEREVATRLGIKRQWSARLMKLAQDLPNILKAIEWAKVTGRLTRSEYSVEGALALLALWQRKTPSGSGNAGPAGENSSGSSFVPKETIKKAKLIEYLKQFIMLLLLELLRARRRIAFLEFEIERLTKASDAPSPDQLVLPMSAGDAR